jgi:hypothetical protein
LLNIRILGHLVSQLLVDFVVVQEAAALLFLTPDDRFGQALIVQARPSVSVVQRT